ncbi:MAG: radical SAM/SPASM domain-containing protein [Candidatus Hodarchaeota archaeon]
MIKNCINPFLKSWLNKLTNTIEYIDFCPTWKCNARCATCGAWKRSKKEISWKLYNQIIENFKKVKRLVIEGGEPTLWNYLYDFCYRFMKFHPKCKVIIITNGFLIERIDIIAGLLKREFSKQLTWLVSLNGIGKTHDKSRGVKNVFEKTVESAKIIKSFGYSVAFSYVPFLENMDEYPQVKELGKSLGIPTWICYFSKAAKFGEHQSWTQETNKTIYNSYSDNLKFFDKWTYEYFLNHVREKKVMPCWAGCSAIHINPEGIIRPCPFDESMVIGKLREDKIEFYSNRKETIKRIPEQCQYQTGELCNDCIVFYSLRRSIPKVLKWKLSH